MDPPDHVVVPRQYWDLEFEVAGGCPAPAPIPDPDDQEVDEPAATGPEGDSIMDVIHGFMIDVELFFGRF